MYVCHNKCILLKRSLYILYKTVNNIVDKPIFQELFMLIERDYLVGYKKILTFAPCKKPN